MALYTDLNMELTAEQISIKEETHKFSKSCIGHLGIFKRLICPDEQVEGLESAVGHWGTYHLGIYNLQFTNFNLGRSLG